MDTLVSTRITLVDIPEFCIELEYTSDFAILHIKRVTGFNRAVLKRMQEYATSLQGFLSLHYGAVYTVAEHHRTDLHKLAPLLGYKEIGRDAQFIVYQRED